ncbi:TadE/TadG family type IV pilus assembly protein [Anderseniella sp. Alg231-50]|uniref:TadE/TadG family type IV pilus assembly protein n=1 Tax=Anderseniella sp. Alg231-50 TaxID=1922226 RepID=UPI00307C54C1
MDNPPVTKPDPVHAGVICKLASFGRKKDGVVSIESAFLFPFMILLLLGMVDLTHAVSIKRKLAVAASAVVDLTTQESVSLDKSDLDDFILAADAILKPIVASNINVEVTNFERDGSNVVERWSHSRGGCGNPPNMTNAALTNLTGEQGDENDIVVATVCLTFQPLVGYIAGGTAWSVAESYAQRPRNGPTLKCNDC